MNLSVNVFKGFSIFSQKFGTAGMLKSTQDKMERQQKAQSQIDFFENQKENLKNMQCDSIEDIARKLEMFHSYEDQIAAVKKQYNNEQMFHAMDEARERGEQIAELAEDYAPKTEEERKEIVSNLENAFTKNKATITLSKELGQRELAYEIKKCKSGFYYLYNIESNDDAAVKEFKRLAKIEENVIRDLVINLDK